MGILASTDILAVDQACIDLVYALEDNQKFQTFITGSVMFIDIGRMCHGTQKQGAVPEPVTDPLFQFCRCRLPCVPGTFHQAFSPSAP